MIKHATPDLQTANVWIPLLSAFGGAILGSISTFIVQYVLLGRRIEADEALADKKFHFDCALAEKKYTFEMKLITNKRKSELLEDALSEMYDITFRLKSAIPIDNPAKTFSHMFFKLEGEATQIMKLLAKRHRMTAVFGADGAKPFEHLDPALNIASSSASYFPGEAVQADCGLPSRALGEINEALTAMERLYQAHLQTE